jgi:hypothetical protein
MLLMFVQRSVSSRFARQTFPVSSVTTISEISLFMRVGVKIIVTPDHVKRVLGYRGQFPSPTSGNLNKTFPHSNPVI